MKTKLTADHPCPFRPLRVVFCVAILGLGFFIWWGFDPVISESGTPTSKLIDPVGTERDTVSPITADELVKICEVETSRWWGSLPDRINISGEIIGFDRNNLEKIDCRYSMEYVSVDHPDWKRREQVAYRSEEVCIERTEGEIKVYGCDTVWNFNELPPEYIYPRNEPDVFKVYGGVFGLEKKELLIAEGIDFWKICNDYYPDREDTPSGVYRISVSKDSMKFNGVPGIRYVINCQSYADWNNDGYLGTYREDSYGLLIIGDEFKIFDIFGILIEQGKVKDGIPLGYGGMTPELANFQIVNGREW